MTEIGKWKFFTGTRRGCGSEGPAERPDEGRRGKSGTNMIREARKCRVMCNRVGKVLVNKKVLLSRKKEIEKQDQELLVFIGATLLLARFRPQ
jgi:hypothetical protein